MEQRGLKQADLVPVLQPLSQKFHQPLCARRFNILFERALVRLQRPCMINQKLRRATPGPSDSKPALSRIFQIHKLASFRHLSSYYLGGPEIIGFESQNGLCSLNWVRSVIRQQMASFGKIHISCQSWIHSVNRLHYPASRAFRFAKCAFSSPISPSHGFEAQTGQLPSTSQIPFATLSCADPNSRCYTRQICLFPFPWKSTCPSCR